MKEQIKELLELWPHALYALWFTIKHLAIGAFLGYAIWWLTR